MTAIEVVMIWILMQNRLGQLYTSLFAGENNQKIMRLQLLQYKESFQGFMPGVDLKFKNKGEGHIFCEYFHVHMC